MTKRKVRCEHSEDISKCDSCWTGFTGESKDSTSADELREQLQGISYKAVVSAYNTSQSGLVDYAYELTEELVQAITSYTKQRELALLERVQQAIIDEYCLDDAQHEIIMAAIQKEKDNQ